MKNLSIPVSKNRREYFAGLDLRFKYPAYYLLNGGEKPFFQTFKSNLKGMKYLVWVREQVEGYLTQYEADEVTIFARAGSSRGNDRFCRSAIMLHGIVNVLLYEMGFKVSWITMEELEVFAANLRRSDNENLSRGLENNGLVFSATLAHMARCFSGTGKYKIYQAQALKELDRKSVV